MAIFLWFTLIQRYIKKNLKTIFVIFDTVIEQGLQFAAKEFFFNLVSKSAKIIKMKKKTKLKFILKQHVTGFCNPKYNSNTVRS